MKKCSTLILLLFSAIVLAQYNNLSSLTLEAIMKGNDFIGHSPESPFWSLDGDTLFYTQAIKNGAPPSMRAYIPSEQKSIQIEYHIARKVRRFPADFSKSKDNYEVMVLNSELWLWDPEMQSLRLLNDDASDLRNISMTSDKKSIYFSKGMDWFKYDFVEGRTKRLTKILSTDPPDKDKKKPSWIATEELDLFEYLRDKKAVKDSMEALRSSFAEQQLGPKSLYIGKMSLSPAQIAANGKFAVYTISTRANNQNTNVPDWITEDGYVAMLNARPKVGTTNSGQKLWVLNIADQDTFSLDISVLPGIYNKPAYLKTYHKQREDAYDPKYSNPKPVTFGAMASSSDGSVLVCDVFSVDNKDRWIIHLDFENKSVICLDHQHDEAWIGGPGIRSWGGSKNIGFIGERTTLYFRSEQDGFSHLYTYDIAKKIKKQHTEGAFEVREIKLSRNQDLVYLMLNKEDPGVYHWYKYDLVSGQLEQLTDLPGKWDLVFNAEETSFASLFSSGNQPPDLYLRDQSGAWEKITNSSSAAFKSYSWRVPQYVAVKAEDGDMVPTRLYLPDEKVKNDAAVIFVHGAGYLQNAHKYWSTYYREYMFHNFLADNGYTVLDIDYRGSAGYGRDWRTAIYRQMGGIDLSDHVDGAKYLVENFGIKEDKVGIYGGSYGGFITLMAMFKHPSVFRAGAALRSVTDWAHYNHGYTSNILNTPETDPDAFRKSSPIYFAEGLEGDLLILHGMVDTNVHFQDVVRLAQRLIELEKDNWEMAVYPVEDHGFSEYKSWLDEYKRIYKLFETKLR